MKKVLIISTSREEQQMIEEAKSASLAALPPGYGDLQFETTASFGQEAIWWQESAPDCLVICLPHDELLQGYFLIKLKRDIPRQLPIVILSHNISANLLQLSQIFRRVRMLKVPVEGTKVLQIVIELTTQWAPNETQVHPRYVTDQVVEVSSETSDIRFNGRMRNLSLSGAYFETDEFNQKFKSGDLLQMSVKIGNPPKDYLFDARVVWVKPLPNETGHGYGVTFIDKEEVYNQLLKGF